MISYKHYYCTNCHYHGPETIRYTHQFKMIAKPHCPNCDKVSTYNDILDYILQDDDTEYGGIGHTDYTLEEYLVDTLYNYDEEKYEEDVKTLLNDPSLTKLNQLLKNSRIKPINVNLL